jgi:hypothetical protein
LDFRELNQKTAKVNAGRGTVNIKVLHFGFRPARFGCLNHRIKLVGVKGLEPTFVVRGQPNWTICFWVAAGIYLIGAACWLFIDPVTPLDGSVERQEFAAS